MRVRGFLALTTFAAVATSVVLPGATAACSFCRYTAWNCSVEEEAMKETSVQALSVDKSELRKETVTEPPLAVCNAEGKIQVDDVFCTDSDCVCAEGKRCASLVLGCQKIFQARSRKRCIGDEAIEQRFHKCARTHALTTQAKANLEADWVHFKDPKQCRSADCAAVRQFHQCGAVECGRLVVAWKESATQYRVVVDGSRASDMEAGTFLFSMDATSAGMCKSITSKKIPDCYSLQTRNQKNGNCDGIYLQADTNLLAADEEHHLSDLSWPVWLTVVGSVGAAFASVASVIIVVLRHRRERQQEECSELLPDDSAELKTPELDPKEAKEASTLADRSLRQRPLSPLQE